MGPNSLPQLLQITDGFFFPAVLQFVVGSFSYKRQVYSRSGLWRSENTHITHTHTCWLLRGKLYPQTKLQEAVVLYSLFGCKNRNGFDTLSSWKSPFVSPSEQKHQQKAKPRDTDLFRLVVLDSLFEDLDGAVDVFFMGVHRYQSGNLSRRQRLRVRGD